MNDTRAAAEQSECEFSVECKSLSFHYTDTNGLPFPGTHLRAARVRIRAGTALAARTLRCPRVSMTRCMEPVFYAHETKAVVVQFMKERWEQA
jgi:hypothetical protein